MVKVRGSRGGLVNIQVLGIGTVIARLRRAGIEIENGADLGVVKAGGFVEEEVKESIMGNRAETKSVDTGRLANSIEFNKTKKMVGVVKPKKQNYPKGGNTKEVATIMEYGSSRLRPRRHFRNTEKRTKKRVRNIIKNEIKLGM